MQAHYSAKDLAPILGKTSRSVARQADSEGWKFMWQKSKQGQLCKVYFTRLLPENIRITLARAEAVEASPPAPQYGDGTRAGYDRGTTITQDQAEVLEQARITKEQNLATFARLPEEQKQTANARREILDARDAFIKAADLPLKRGSQAFCNEYRDGYIQLPSWVIDSIGSTVSWSSLNRWQQAFDELGIVGLANGYKSPNKGRTSLSQEHRKFVKGLLTDHPHISLIKIMASMEARFAGQSIPHISSVRRYVKRWKKEHSSLLLYVTNPDVWKNKHQQAQGDASEQATRLNQIWEFDSTPADVMLKEGRHCLIGVIDVYSRRPKLLVSPSSRATAVAALTRRAVMEWGVPEIAKTDNGSDYVSRHMVRVFEGLGIEQILCPPFTPETKPHIERFFKTFSHDIVELMPGYIGHNVNDRKAIEARRSFADRLM
ncbi:DDE-type integrase/transposase/recombinase, partial [Thermodesulfobacteriota bacterium]